MTDKEFMELLVLFQDGKVPLMDVGLALANNQFTPESLALANNILLARREKNKTSRAENVLPDKNAVVDEVRNESMFGSKCPANTVQPVGG